MKKILLSFFIFSFVLKASAQLSIGVHGNYTMYKQQFKQNTTGFGARLSYEFYEKFGLQLSYTNASAITIPSTVDVYNNMGQVKTVASEFQYNFKSFQLLAKYNFVGDAESAGKLYGLIGAGLVIAKYTEDIKEDYDKTVYTSSTQTTPGSETGPTINLGLGGEYKFGAPSLFIEAGAALPANKTGYTYIENNIPFHFIFNAGLKFPIGHR